MKAPILSLQKDLKGGAFKKSIQIVFSLKIGLLQVAFCCWILFRLMCC